MVNPGRRGHAQNDRFEGQQAARLQRIAFERHGQGENKFDHQNPAGDVGADGIKKDRVGDQKAENRNFVPFGGMAKKVSPIRVRKNPLHAFGRSSKCRTAPANACKGMERLVRAWKEKSSESGADRGLSLSGACPARFGSLLSSGSLQQDLENA